MQYDRQTINLVFEIKRALPLHLQDGLKLASPDLVDKVKDIYLNINKDDVKALAARFLHVAGIDVEYLSRSKAKPLARLYRGVEIAVDSERTSESNDDNSMVEPVDNKPTKMYRGQIVRD